MEGTRDTPKVKEPRQISRHQNVRPWQELANLNSFGMCVNWIQLEIKLLSERLVVENVNMSVITTTGTKLILMLEIYVSYRVGMLVHGVFL